MTQPRSPAGRIPLNRREFLSRAAAAVLLPELAVPQAAEGRDTAQDSVELPILQVPSADPALPGTWHILDRSKPIRKLVDRKSLLPVGNRSLVVIETTQQLTLARNSPECFLIVTLPADVGDEQTLLGCLPWVRTEKGTDIPFRAVFHQAKGNGGRVAQIALGECPGETTIQMGVHYVLLNPPALTPAQKSAVSQSLKKRTGKNKKPDATTLGFPEASFQEGGPAFVGAAAGPSQFQTINNVLKATDQVVAYNGSSQFETADPEVAKTNKKGPCGPRSRTAEKALVGVARAAAVTIFHEIASTRHAFVLIEDPDTGHYFIGDLTMPEPTLCMHHGSCYILSPYRNEGIPNPYNLKVDISGPGISHFVARSPIMDLKPLTLTGSTNVGARESAACKARLKNLPGKFRDLEKQLKA